MAEIVGKKELCERIGWSRPRLDRRLIEDPRFPVERRGDQSGGWGFNPKKVERYLNGDPPEKAPKGIDLAQLRDAVKQPAPATIETKKRPSGNRLPAEAEAAAMMVIEALQGASAKPEGKARKSAYHSGEASARQRKDEAQAALLEERLKVAQGEVISREDVIALINESVLYLKDFLDSLPVQLCKRLNLPDIASGEIAALMEAARKEFVEMTRKKFQA